ncbi:hypothetical protein D1007_05870 [Hordeum vulgare]|nr:hypothetical protein D1007_05870 [Hordeum vulgare]KAI4997087.1 hypothetical protein ZWY2020_052429 [Hordeum vulgare]
MARSKTLSGINICDKGGFALTRLSARLQSSGHTRKQPVAKKAQTLVCRSLRIIQDREDITEKALDDFAASFKNELPYDVLGAMRVFFRLDDALINAAKEGLIGHGGSSGLDNDEVGAQAVVV